MTERRPCPDCHARPIASARAKRCLACAKASGLTSWRQLLTRVRDRDGDAAARALAKEQGVPYSCAASPGGGAPVSAPQREQRERPASGEPAPMVDVEPLELGRLAGSALKKALIRLAEHIDSDEITPGQLAQMVKPLHGIWAEIAGGTTASNVTVVFRRAPPRDEAA